jgi:hypothetical protein
MREDEDKGRNEELSSFCTGRNIGEFFMLIERGSQIGASVEPMKEVATSPKHVRFVGLVQVILLVISWKHYEQ